MAIDKILGLFIGGGIFLIITLVGGLIAGKEAMGFGDVKLMAALGFITGLKGIITVIIGMSVISAMAFTVLIAMKKIKRTDSKPLGPYISAAAVIYMLVIWQI